MTAAALNGATAMACAAIAVFFARFWNESRDLLFAGLSAGFGLVAANYALLGAFGSFHERGAFAFLLRLAGLLTILFSVLLKDREYVDPLDVDEEYPKHVA